MARWYSYHNKWMAFHRYWDGWLSFGIHMDFKARRTAKEGIRYGPYIDFHFLWFILSFGVNPYYSTDLDSVTFRGGYTN